MNFTAGGNNRPLMACSVAVIGQPCRAEGVPELLRAALTDALLRQVHAPWWTTHEARATRALLAVVEVADGTVLRLIARELLEAER